jgi:N-methylhydantoinase A/oxoprolinase/acetone carboxylase beta subunit
VDVLDRAALVPGEQVGGPVVVQERESGFAIREGDRLTVHPCGTIFVELG